MPAAIIGYSVAYDYYTYGTHVSRVRSVTHTGYGTDPADIPKKAMSSVQLQTPSICHICANTGQKISRRNNANNIALATVMVIRRIKDMCGQVISVRYPDKENHDR